MNDPINPQHYKHLPVEAIEIIEAAIEGAPSPQAAAAQSHLLGYALRANQKGQLAIDAGKAEWYAARWVKAIREAEAKAIPASETPSYEPSEPSSKQPPKGYRFLTKQDFYAKLDEFINATGKREPVPEALIGQRVHVNKPHSWIRRCEFERGERVAIQFVDGILTVNGKEPGYIDCYSVQLDGFSSRRCRAVDAKNLIPLEQPSAPPKRYREPTLDDLRDGPIECEVGDRHEKRTLIYVFENEPGRARFATVDKEMPGCVGRWIDCRIEVAE